MVFAYFLFFLLSLTRFSKNFFLVPKYIFLIITGSDKHFDFPCFSGFFFLKVWAKAAQLPTQAFQTIWTLMHNLGLTEANFSF